MPDDTIVLLVLLSGPALSATNGDPHCAPGRETIVHLFEWKWSDIAKECERFLGPQGFCGVQTSPPTENRVVTSPNRPWWERYQPVSYRLITRSGDENDFKDMVNRCNAADVRVYTDAVINHMAEVGFTGIGTGGSTFDSHYLNFPGVPYHKNDFNDGSQCPTHDLNIDNFQNPTEVRNCRLLKLADLNLNKEEVRTKVADFLNHVIDLGVAGFRIDAAKHIWPEDIRAVMGKVKNLRSDIFGPGQRPFVIQEVIYAGGEYRQYLDTGRVTNFQYGFKIAQVFRGQNAMKWLVNWGEEWGIPKSEDSLVFIDNHDTQRGRIGDDNVLTHWEPRLYKLATAFMLAHPFGFPQVMSSFNYNRANPEEGPPHNANMSLKEVSINSDGTCGGGWSCEHRWPQISNMVGFRNAATGAPLENWWSGADYQIAFSRGKRAFIALNLETFDISTKLETGLPAGNYCDVITGGKNGASCSGRVVTVGENGTAHILVGFSWQDPMVAIHVNAKL